MRKNYRVPRKMSVIATRSMYAAAMIVMAFVMVILNFLADSSCTQLMKSIGEKEKLLGKLEESRQRESTKWEEMIAPDRLERHLVKCGLSMHYPKAAQIVNMRPDGTPARGQLSLVKAEARVRSRSLAMADASGATPAARPVRRATPVAATPRRALGVSAVRRR